MSEFVFLFQATEADQREAMGTPERAQRSLQAWLAWMRDLEANGHLKNRGQPLELAGRLTPLTHVSACRYLFVAAESTFSFARAAESMFVIA
jgi:hypothetical protein